MNILLALDPTAERYQPLYERMYDAISSYGVTVVNEEEALADSAGVVAELSSQPPELLTVVRNAIEIGRPTLILAHRYGKMAIPKEFEGQSKVNPNGVHYSAEFVAMSAVHVFMGAYFKTPVRPENIGWQDKKT